MVISGLGASDSSSLITSKAASTSSASASSSNANSSGGDGISLDLQFVNSVLDGTDTFTENSASYHLLSQLNTDILDNGSLAGVRSQIDTYTNSLASSNVYESVYSAPSASFLADLKALKSDAAAGNLTAAATDLGNAKLVAPQYAQGADAAGDTSGLASVIEEHTNDMADYLQTQGYSAVNAKAEANAITLAFTPSLGLSGAGGRPPSDPTVTSEITSLATSAATRDSSTTGGTSDPMFNIIQSLLQSTAVSDSASLQTLSLLNSLYATNGATSTATNKDAASTPSVSSYA